MNFIKSLFKEKSGQTNISLPASAKPELGNRQYYKPRRTMLALENVPQQNGLVNPDANDLETLKKIALDIINPETTLADLIPSIVELRAVVERRTLLKLTQEPHENLSTGQTRLDNGTAVSPLVAALCAREVFRTAAFIKGLGEAIADVSREDHPVRVLYAGCGPFALLALPLMAVFSARQVVFSLIDIHPESLRCVKELLDGFGFSEHVSDYLCTDATQYLIPSGSIPDVIVSETMNVCLGKEPQVSIARHLLAQAPDALMVPQAVKVEACLLDLSKEHVPLGQVQEGVIAGPVRDRVYLGKLFELDVDHIRQWADITADRLPAACIKIPSPLLGHYQVRLLTRIIVYKQTCLNDYDSSLNLPQYLPGKPAFTGGEVLQFHYKLGPYPGLGFERVDACLQA